MNLLRKTVRNKYFPIAVIILVWVAFASPFFLKDKVPFPSDYQVAFFSPWSAYKELFIPVKNDSMPDIVGQIYPWRFFAINSWKDLQVPLWNPNSFGGTPHLANYQSSVLSPLNVGFFLFPFINWWSFLILLQPLFAGIFTYYYARTLSIRREAAIVSSLSFMFCGFLVSWMAYGTLGFAILYLPLALFAIEKYFDQEKAKYLFLLCISIPLSFFSGHFQISLYFLLFLSSYLLFKAFQTKNIRSSIYLSLAVLFGLFITLPQLLPSAELYLQSFRSTIFQKTEVIPWGYVGTFLAPDFFGNPVTRNAWFGHYAEWNAYFGLIPLFLAFYALFYFKKRFVLFFAIAGLISLLLAFQSPIQDLLLFLRVPVLSTSALSRIIVLFSFSGAILAGFGFTFLLEDIKGRRYKKLFIVSIIFILCFATLWGIALSKMFFTPEHSHIGVSNLRLPSVIFVGLLASFCIAYFFKKRDALIVVILVVIVLLTLDMLRFANKWLPVAPKPLAFAKTEVMDKVKVLPSDRVFGKFGAEAAVYYSLPVLDGYDAVYIRRYGQFIASINTGKLTDSPRSGVDIATGGKHLRKAANFLGVRYFIHKLSDGQNVWEFPFWKYNPTTIKLLFDDSHYQILQNDNAFPRAFLVSKTVTIKNPQKILNTMFNSKTNLRNVAVIEENPEKQQLLTGKAEIKTYTPNKIEIQTKTAKSKSNNSSFLVLTDSFYPGWKVYLIEKDGSQKELKIYRTDFAFRGVFVPNGTQNIIYVYDPASFRYGVYAAIIGILGIGSLCYIVSRQKKKNS